MCANGLYLHPFIKDSATIENDQLLSLLLQLGLVGDPIQINGKSVWSTGPRFTELIVFLGCSPHIITQAPEEELPADSSSLNYIELSNLEAPQLFTGNNSVSPNCPTCRHPVQNAASTKTCSKCKEEIDLSKLHWRKTGGFAQRFIRINGIYPFEAIPSDELLLSVSSLSNDTWKYFFIYH